MARLDLMEIEMLQYDPDRVYDLPTKEIFVDSDFNCRGAINPMDVIDLSKDIKTKGLHTPVFVEPWDKVPGKKYRLVAGYRRFKAHMLNEADSQYQESRGDKAYTIRSMVKENLTDLEARGLNLSENIQRVNLTIKQEAHALEPFKLAGWSEQQVMEHLKMSRGWVQVRYMLLELPEQIQDEAAAGFLTQQQIRHCYTLSQTNVEAAFDYVKAIKDKKLLGKIRPVKPEDFAVKNEKRVRTETEIYAMQDTIRDVFGNNMATRVLGWVSGNISDLEMHREIWTQANLNGKFYVMPSGLTDRMPVFEGSNPTPEPARSND